MSKSDLAEVHVLVVEDNLFQRKLLVRILEGLGVGAVMQAADGEEALHIMASFVPDIIITDSRMQPVDGLEFARRVRRAEGESYQKVPMIMVSVEGTCEEVNAARDAGIEDFLVKPVRPEVFRERILHLISHPRPFVRCRTYVGPDRRMRQEWIPNSERRHVE